MTILRDTLYSDKVLAVIREYSANAWDAHREVGKKDVPIKVMIPTSMAPTLVIQDYGPGLSHDDVFHVYTQYGASTKRNSDEAVGMLGIGSKSGFAYSDSFTIVSCHGGVRRTYVAVLDKSEEGAINLLFEEPCGDETGVAIQVAVRQEDVGEFHEKARKLFQFFEPRPDINIDLPLQAEPKAVLPNGTLFDRGQGMEGWVAVMGCVPYRINLEQLRGIDTPDGKLADYARYVSGVIYFNIGEVQINASREELKYNAPTKHAIIKKLNAVVDDYVHHVLDGITKGDFTPWERRVKAQILNRLNLPVPTECKDIVAGYVSWENLPPACTFELTHERSTVKGISIQEDTRILLRDDGRSLAGYRLGRHDYVVRLRNDAADWPIAKMELDAFFTVLNLDGIPISNLSGLPWYKPTKTAAGKTINQKHKLTTFRLLGKNTHKHPWSGAWEAEEREPTDEDVFVILNNFKVVGRVHQFYDTYSNDVWLGEMLGGEVPEIYGYKSTTKKPVGLADCKGMDYYAWRKVWAQSLLTPKVKTLLEHWQWARVIGESYNWRSERTSKENLKTLLEALGENHPITVMVRRQQEGFAALKKTKDDIGKALANLHSRLFPDGMPSPAKAHIEALRAKYPLIALPNTAIDQLWGEHSAAWTHYIQLIDAAT
jgi:hypothetical protein